MKTYKGYLVVYMAIRIEFLGGLWYNLGKIIWQNGGEEMPGMIEHLYFDNLIYHSLSARPTTKILKDGNVEISVYKQVLNRERFMLAGIMPDLTEDKFKAHYKYISRKIGLYVPDLRLADRMISHTWNDWSIRTGLYAHMYFDQKFVMEFLVPRFDWDTEGQKITSIATGEEFSSEQFFSLDGLFGAYAEVATALLSGGRLRAKLVENLPDDLPEVKMPEMEPVKDWRLEFERQASNVRAKTDRIFPVDEAINFIEEQATLLTAYMLYTE